MTKGSVAPARPSLETIRELWRQTEPGKDGIDAGSSELEELEEYYTSMAGSIQLRALAMHRETKSHVPEEIERAVRRHIDEIEREFRVCSQIMEFLLREH